MRDGAWIERGFDDFIDGTFGNAGQNLYVSRAGVLQRIHLFDLNRDGWLDLVLCNAQDHHESPPAFIYSDVFGEAKRSELPAEGCLSAVVCDLNGDGLDDLVLANQANGATRLVNALLYYGSEDGWTTKFHTRIPAPRATDVAAGDFNGDGKPDLVFVYDGKLRVFYQNQLGFEPKRFHDLDIASTQIGAADLDGDGFADLYVLRGKSESPRVYWGGKDGIHPKRFTDVPVPVEAASAEMETVEVVSAEEGVHAMNPLAKVLKLGTTWHLFVGQRTQALLVPVTGRGKFGPPMRFGVQRALSVAAGDLRGAGSTDLVFAAMDRTTGTESSWVYWGGPGGYHEKNRLALPSMRACDAAVGDLDGDGCDDVILCQHRSDDNYSFHSLVFRGGKSGLAKEPIRLPTEGARRVCIARPSPDRKPRVIFANRYSRNALGRIDVGVFWGAKDGFRSDRVQYLPGLGCVLALGCDLNDDGRPDLVLANCAENAIHLDPGSFVYLGGRNGLPGKPDLTFSTSGAMAVACADLNRDGYLDLVFSTFGESQTLFFYGSARGFDFKNPRRLQLEDDGRLITEGRRLCLADFNNDGWLDLVVTSVGHDRCFIYWGGPDGFREDRRQALSVFRASAPQAADLTGNGYLDLIIGSHKPTVGQPHDSFVYIYWNGPDGLREDRRTQIPITCALNIAIADFNNDGFLDLFVPSYHDGRVRDIDSFLFWGGPDHNYSADRCTAIFTHSAAGCLAADFNEDGYIDLAVANHKTHGDHVGESWVLWNGPQGFSKDGVTKLPSKGPHGIMIVGPGNQRDRGPEEYYVSNAHQLPEGARVTGISWDAELPPKTWVRAQLRIGNSKEELSEARWFGPTGEQSWFDHPPSTILHSPSSAGRWVQYRLALGATNGGCTPRVKEVRIAFS